MKTGKHTLARGLALTLAVFAALFCGAVAAVQQIGASSESMEEQLVLDAVRSAALTCYAVEGAYPQSLEALKHGYGLAYNEDALYRRLRCVCLQRHAGYSGAQERGGAAVMKTKSHSISGAFVFMLLGAFAVFFHAAGRARRAGVPHDGGRRFGAHPQADRGGVCAQRGARRTSRARLPWKTGTACRCWR